MNRPKYRMNTYLILISERWEQFPKFANVFVMDQTLTFLDSYTRICSTNMKNNSYLQAKKHVIQGTKQVKYVSLPSQLCLYRTNIKSDRFAQWWRRYPLIKEFPGWICGSAMGFFSNGDFFHSMYALGFFYISFFCLRRTSLYSADQKLQKRKVK